MPNQSVSLAHSFARHLDSDPEATAIVVGDDRWTRAQLSTQADRVITTLLAAGAKPGDAVVAHYDTGFEDVAVALAAARVGCVFMPIPKRLGEREFRYVVELADPTVVMVNTDVQRAMVDEREGMLVTTRAEIAADQPTAVEPHAWAGDVPAVVGFTSGSTGLPKGVMHGWSSMDWVADRIAERAGLSYGEAICVTGAGAGAPGFTFYTYLGLTRGLPIVKSEKWDPARVVELMAREKCVWSTMVPTMLLMLMRAREELGDALDLSSMRTISMGGSPMSSDLIADARRIMGFEVLRVYAMAEVMMHCHMGLDSTQEERNLLDGKPGPDCDLVILGPSGERLPDGEVGEVAMRGPSLMLGYLGDPSGVEGMLTSEGFLRSGDLGRKVEGGYVKIVGRLKDMIIRGGFNIDPSEVEELIRLYPGVRDVAVVGYPDPVYGERACAWIWTDEEVTMADLVQHLLGLKLSKEKLPERVVCTHTVPQSPDGKILKGELRKILAHEAAKATA